MELKNYETVNVKVTRHELSKLLLACANLHFDENLSEGSREKWGDIHNKLRKQLDEFDKKQNQQD